jgi:hypothetical protein
MNFALSVLRTMSGIGGSFAGSKRPGKPESRLKKV